MSSTSTRLEAFSDAVFGFALTLLVVALEVPDSFAELEQSRMLLVAYGLGFAAVFAIFALM